MKEYLKMSGYFSGSVEINANGQICDDKNFRGSTDIAEDYYLPICHAINSHDELVAEVERLRDVISKIKNPSNDDCLEFLCSAFRHCDYEISGDFDIEDMKPAFILYANKKGA